MTWVGYDLAWAAIIVLIAALAYWLGAVTAPFDNDCDCQWLGGDDGGGGPEGPKSPPEPPGGQGRLLADCYDLERKVAELEAVYAGPSSPPDARHTSLG